MGAEGSGTSLPPQARSLLTSLLARGAARFAEMKVGCLRPQLRPQPFLTTLLHTAQIPHTIARAAVGLDQGAGPHWTQAGSRSLLPSGTTLEPSHLGVEALGRFDSTQLHECLWAVGRIQGSGHRRHESVFMACCCSGQTVDNVRLVREVELTSRVEQVLPPALSQPILPTAGTSGVAPSLAPRCFMESSQGAFLVLGISVVGLEVWWGPWGAWGQNVKQWAHHCMDLQQQPGPHAQCPSCLVRLEAQGQACEGPSLCL